MRRLPVVFLLAVAAPLAGCEDERRPIAAHTRQIADGDPEHGRRLIADIRCGVCHVVPGVAGASGVVGPPLTNFADRTLIAGRFPNAPDTLTRFLRDAPSLAPETGMPAMPLDEAQARHVAAYLYTLR
jgi:mono/diheme cytochrome c family protein